jgi:hypothetical protein
MTTDATAARTQREAQLLGQTVVLIGGSAGIGLETARRARSEGAEVVLTGRNPERLEQAARDVDARGTAAFDATDAAALKRFFDELPAPIDHVLVRGPGPSYVPLLEMDALPSRRPSRSSSPRCASTHQPPASRTRRCRRRTSPPTGSKPGARSCARRSRSAVWSGPADVAALAVHLMTNIALTGATYDIDGGQQFVA